MKMQVAQLGAIVKYEFRMHWRRRTLLVMMVGMVGPAILFSLFGREALVEWVGLPSGLIDLQRIVISLTWTPVYAVALMAIPPLVADAIPKDRQSGVSELLGSVPLSTGVYLFGKVFGLWASALAGLAVVIPLAGAAFRISLGNYDLGVYLQMWAFAALPLILVNTGLAALMAAGMPNRRWAILTGIAFAMFNILMLITIELPESNNTLWASLNPARPAPLFYYSLFGGESPLGGVTVSLADVGWAGVGGLTELVVVGAIAWLWLRRKERTN